MNKQIRTRTFLFCSAALYFSIQAQGDKLELSNGDHLTGELRGIAGKLVEFETTYAGLLRIDQDQVASIETELSFLIVESDGKRGEREFDLSVALDSVTLARKQQDHLLGEATDLEHKVDLSGSYSVGNASTQVYLLTTESTLTKPMTEHIFSSTFNVDVAEGEELKNQVNLNYKTRRFFREKWFYALNADGFRDPLKSIDLRLTPTAGLGHRFWDHNYGALIAEAGIAVLYERSDNVRNEHPAFSWELDYSKRFLGGRLEAFHEHRLLTAIDKGIVVDSTNGLKYSLVENVNLNLLATLKHDTNVPAGVEKTDVTYVAGVGLTF